MKTAWCAKCGLRMQVRHTAPDSCPRCGYSGSKADLAEMTKLRPTMNIPVVMAELLADPTLLVAAFREHEAMGWSYA